MTTLSSHIDRRLARLVAVTGRMKTPMRQKKKNKRLAAAIDFMARGIFYLWRNHRYLSVIKLSNMGLAQLEFKLKREKLISRPYNLKIESTNICNTKCQLCPTGLGLQGRAKGKMSFEQYKKLIRELRWHVFGVDLSMWGDPLIVPEIYDMIKFTRDNGIWTYISSNLHAFKIEPKRGETKDQATKLIESGLELLTCSLHGATQATYEKYQPGKKLDDSITKIKHIIATRDKMKSRTPAVQLNFVVTRHNEHEKQAFQDLASKLGCKAIFSTASMNIRFLDQDQKLQPLGLAADVLAKKTKDHLEEWLPNDREYVLDPYVEIKKTGEQRSEKYNGHKPFDCSWPWLSSVINWDGEVVTCCGSFDTKDDMGSVFDQKFSKIWNGKTYQLARRSFKSKLDTSDAKNNPCAECPGYML
ncbi:radical SAM/SPASM domain-containing protein [Poriferisphaera sp. WC338]|uniref:radical SAM/SPASM domain-containing protein n=1 Tax=Poriferisphaera sp. WC338 TaxID=3425129 RepID=UPI003D81BAD7